MLDNERLKELVAKFPTPAAKDGKLAEVDKDATDAALAEFLKGGKDAVLGLVQLLVRGEKGGDGQVRHAIHALVIHVGGRKAEEKRMVAEALASLLEGDQPEGVKPFVLQQLQFIGGKEVVPAVAKLLADETLAETAVQTLVAIKVCAAPSLRAALPNAKNRQVIVIVQALGTLKDPESASELRKLLASNDSGVRQVAGWALANMGDAECAKLLLKQSTLAEGYERVKLTQACFLLAENLLAAGKKKEAAAIYQHLSDTRREAVEKYIKDAADRGLAGLE
ncbi:MAG: HEAT repeat domain-containing protein [Planctomycetia bacterium]|nr:HEAT repeat domain-containing protein [Planctomycetia bacterium]